MTLIGAFLTALVMAREWERGTFEAMFVTPIRSGEILVGKTAPYFMLGMIGLFLCILSGKYLFEVPLRGSNSLFVSERGGPFTTDSFNWLVKRAGRKAKLPFQAHAHMLRHACGYALANAGHDTRSLQDYLGHKNIQHTVRYTELAPTRFKDFWR